MSVAPHLYIGMTFEIFSASGYLPVRDDWLIIINNNGTSINVLRTSRFVL